MLVVQLHRSNLERHQLPGFFPKHPCHAVLGLLVWFRVRRVLGENGSTRSTWGLKSGEVGPGGGRGHGSGAEKVGLSSGLSAV